MWLKGELNMGHVVHNNTTRGQHSDDGINAWFSRMLKKRRMKESVDYRVKGTGACHMTGLWIGSVTSLTRLRIVSFATLYTDFALDL
jgi:hypothetical protein